MERGTKKQSRENERLIFGGLGGVVVMNSLLLLTIPEAYRIPIVAFIGIGLGATMGACVTESVYIGSRGVVREISELRGRMRFRRMPLDDRL